MPSDSRTLVKLSSCNRAILGDALSLYARMVERDGVENPKPRHIILYALKEAFETLRHQPDREKQWQRVRSSWPAIARDGDEQLGAYEALLARIAKGEESADVLLMKRSPTPQAVARMNAVIEEFPKLLVGRSSSIKSRDWRILWLFASGREAGDVARKVGCPRHTAYDRRDTQADAIARALEDIMPLHFRPGSKKHGFSCSRAPIKQDFRG